MIAVIGLGNPGIKYTNNRHNVGHLFVDYLNEQIKNEKFKIIKTEVFMNQSGRSIKKIVENWELKIENLVIIHDDLDIPLGKFKIQKGVGPKLHNGIESIEQVVKTKDFWRVRIGVDNRPYGPERAKRVEGETYVLQDFTQEEQMVLSQTFPKISTRLGRDFG